MTTDLVTIERGSSVQEALSTMKRFSIRHLPVVDRDARLVGWVTDADLRSVLIASMLEDLTVEDVMVGEPYRVSSQTPLEQAAALILNKKIGGMPVVDEEKLVGVITTVDILRAFISMLGVMESSSRLDVKAEGRMTTLDEVTHLLQSRGVEIISVCHLRPSDPDRRVYSFRIKKCDLTLVVESLRERGLEVVSSEE